MQVNNSRITPHEGKTSSIAKLSTDTNDFCLPALCFKPVICWCCNGILYKTCYKTKSECKRNCD